MTTGQRFLASGQSPGEAGQPLTLTWLGEQSKAQFCINRQGREAQGLSSHRAQLPTEVEVRPGGVPVVGGSCEGRDSAPAWCLSFVHGIERVLDQDACSTGFAQ